MKILWKNNSQQVMKAHLDSSRVTQVVKPQVTSGEPEWALSDEFGNYSCDFSSA